MNLRRLALVVILAGCHHQGRGTLPARTQQVVDAQAIATPSNIESDRELAACSPGIVLLPHAGGIVIAGYNDWAVEPKPDAPQITAVSCDESDNIFYVRGTELVRHSATGDDRTTVIPQGTWQLLATVANTAWLYGTRDDGQTAIYFVDDAAKLHLLHRGKQVIHAASVVGTMGFAAVLDNDLVVWNAGEGHIVGTLGPAIDGLAVGPDGTLYVSGPAGVAQFAATAQEPKQLTIAVHGPLRLRGDVLYVLWREASVVMRLRPYERPKPPQREMIAETITVPPSKFWNGPARDRKSAFPLSAGYLTASQTTPLHAVDHDAIVAEEVQLKDPITFNGFTLSWDLAAMVARHITASVELGIASGSGKPTNVVLDPNASQSSKSGSIIDPANVNMIRLGIPIGFRFPTGWFSTSVGSGVELVQYVITAWQDMAVAPFPANPFSTHVGGTWIPLWARFELEPWCKLTFFVQGGHSFARGETPDYNQFSIGFTYHARPNCY